MGCILRGFEPISIGFKPICFIFRSPKLITPGNEVPAIDFIMKVVDLRSQGLNLWSRAYFYMFLVENVHFKVIALLFIKNAFYNRNFVFKIPFFHIFIFLWASNLFGT